MHKRNSLTIETFPETIPLIEEILAKNHRYSDVFLAETTLIEGTEKTKICFVTPHPHKGEQFIRELTAELEEMLNKEFGKHAFKKKQRNNKYSFTPSL